ncbi:hypothetical protein MLD38_027538 [Melastoma candidum]|uniref:Uncharacterized protein n=1 Tax=Melastoma candidum TaxID=119954 RepID=A0ACB9P349_9MYRT|nr:hypothetical protein MLD38_027538 [Melastoma candidum]
MSFAAIVRRTLTANLSSSVSARSYYKSRSRKPSLYDIISPRGGPDEPLRPILDHWVDQGNKVRFAELQRLVRDLRRRRRFSQALEVSEWMIKKDLFTASAVEHAVQLNLIGKVHGHSAAEIYFENLPEQEKTYKTHGALLNCYVREAKVDKSLAHLQKMQEMGIALTPLHFNNIMCLYTRIKQHEKVPGLLAEMRARKVLPDNYSYRICLNAYGAMSDINRMEEILTEMETQPHIAMDWTTFCAASNFYIQAGIKGKASDMLKRAEERLDKKDEIGYNQLISLHAKLGNKEEILRLWELEKIACTRYLNKDYMNMLKALVKLGEFEGAEKVLRDWELSGNCFDHLVPRVLFRGYCDVGQYENAEAVLKRIMDEGNVTVDSSWGKLAAGYSSKGDMESSLRCIKVALSPHVTRWNWKPGLEVVAKLLHWLGDKGNAAEVNAFVYSLRPVLGGSKECYGSLVDAGLRGFGYLDVLKPIYEGRMEKQGNTEQPKLSNLFMFR